MERSQEEHGDECTIWATQSLLVGAFETHVVSAKSKPFVLFPARNSNVRVVRTVAVWNTSTINSEIQMHTCVR